jgi:hypothetical protein
VSQHDFDVVALEIAATLSFLGAPERVHLLDKHEYLLISGQTTSYRESLRHYRIFLALLIVIRAVQARW